MWNCHKHGVCRPSQESIVRSIKIEDLKLYGLRAEIFPNLEDHGRAIWPRVVATPGTMPWKGARLGHNKDLDNPIWLRVCMNRMFRELAPSMRTWLSLAFLMMGQTMRGYHPGFGTKSGWSLRSKVMGTSDHLRYSAVVCETAMTSWAVSFCFHHDSYESGPPYM
jgi:hypothetical protein